MPVRSIEERAIHARRLLEDPLLQEMFEAVRQEALSRFADSQPEEAHVRESAYRDLRAVENVQETLKSAIVDMQLLSPSQKG